MPTFTVFVVWTDASVKDDVMKSTSQIENSLISRHQQKSLTLFYPFATKAKAGEKCRLKLHLYAF